MNELMQKLLEACPHREYGWARANTKTGFVLLTKNPRLTRSGEIRLHHDWSLNNHRVSKAALERLDPKIVGDVITRKGIGYGS